MKSALAFIAGLAAGSAVTWYMTKTYYQKIADEEIESVKEEFLRQEEKSDDSKPEEVTENKENVIDQERRMYSKVIEDSGYAGEDSNQPGGAEPGIDLIPPDQAGEEVSYGFDVLNYYSDGILALDRNDEIIRDIQGTISELAIHSFGLYEANTITVCNHNQEMYYEVNRCSCTYRQAAGMDPE